MREVIIALISSSLAIIFTNLVNYYFLIKQESRSQANSYKVDILHKVYTPITKLIMRDVYPGDGYEGITQDTFKSIETIVEDNYQLISPDMDRIIWSIREDIVISSQNQAQDKHNQFIKLDEDSRLLDHVDYSFNYYRKELGLPFDKYILKIIRREIKKEQKTRDSHKKRIEKMRRTNG
ncbi:hypothetical protein FQ085_06540 [Planococcus sp. ANT_H30]|uniref:hypothetical protein n=1 Tax=Planococcus sp. ANT_H30 TaxID=2597347 RepID=UPI0011ED953F|nr:hypothetical protein [Planococcus sp. ANT_H30]KAA0957704.1 hypothetical protein FQ085_06540 [Planococcus sp. ANT_H30]